MFKGSIPALVTPMRDDGAIDFDAWDALLDFHLREGTGGIVVGGTTGESPVLDRAEAFGDAWFPNFARGNVLERIPEARERGITGVPAFVVNDEWVIPGAQDTERMVQLLSRVGGTT